MDSSLAALLGTYRLAFDLDTRISASLLRNKKEHSRDSREFAMISNVKTLIPVQISVGLEQRSDVRTKRCLPGELYRLFGQDQCRSGVCDAGSNRSAV